MLQAGVNRNSGMLPAHVSPSERRSALGSSRARAALETAPDSLRVQPALRSGGCYSASPSCLSAQLRSSLASQVYY